MTTVNPEEESNSSVGNKSLNEQTIDQNYFNFIQKNLLGSNHSNQKSNLSNKSSILTNSDFNEPSNWTVEGKSLLEFRKYF